MNETYTFSRALHMMRYGGKKMRSVNWGHDFYCFVSDNSLHFIDTGINDIHKCCDFSSEEIMGSWVEVKDESK